MKTDNLKIIQISEQAFDWLKSKYNAVDSMNAELYRSFLADDCQLMFGNNPVVKCNNEIIGGLKYFWDAIEGLGHSFVSILGYDHHFAAEALIDYIRRDKQIVTIPCVTVIERNEAGLAIFIKIHIDTSPIFD